MTPLITPQVEVILQENIFPDLLRGRKDFDLPHTQAVVYWMKRMITVLDDPTLDPLVLITAAYAHDWGYIGLFDGVDSTDINIIHKMKPLHMERGSEMIKKLIHEKLSQFFSDEQCDAASHLVLVHDKIEELQTDIEILLMEADTLGMLDADRVKPTFTKEDNDVFIQREFYGRRLPKFTHPVAREFALILVQKRLDFYISSSSIAPKFE